MKRLAVALAVAVLGSAIPVFTDDALPPALTAAVGAWAKAKGAGNMPEFKWAVVDLNGDRTDDAIVLVAGPDWCGSGGCSMVVFRGGAKGFSYVSGSTVTWNPIRVSPEKVKGWSTLIVEVRGGDAIMRFDGTRYPLNPTTQPMATRAQIDAARIVIK